MPRDDLVRDNIAQPLSPAVYDIGETLGGRDLQPIFGYLFTRPEAIDYADADGLTDCIFFRDRDRRVAVVFPMSLAPVPIAGLGLDKADIDSVRAEIGRATGRASVWQY